MANSLCAAMLRKPMSTGPLQCFRQRYRLQGRAEQIIGDADDAEGDADGHQHLGQLRGTVDTAVEQPLQRQGDDHRRRHRQQHGGAIGEAEIARRIGGDVAADHREGAVRQVDHLHQPHGHRQADRDDEQHHAIGQGVRADAQQGLHRAARPRASCRPISPRRGRDRAASRRSGFPCCRGCRRRPWRPRADRCSASGAGSPGRSAPGRAGSPRPGP